MKKSIMGALILGASFTSAQEIKINVEVANVQKGQGTVVLNVYNKKENFLKTAYYTKVLKANEGTIKFQVDLPRGIYAITVFQDLDNNGSLTSNWLGIPKEPVGNSTNFKPDGGAPTFRDCSVYVLDNESKITIDLY